MVTVDLKKDAQDIAKMLQEAVHKYSADKNPPATRVDVTFSLGDSESTPWVHINFDTKPGCEPDGEPTHPDFARLERETWLPAFQAVCNEEQVTVVTEDGKSIKCSDYAQFKEVLGNFLIYKLLEARESKIFAALPKGERCELGVEDPTTGDFGWPNYDDRGKHNLL